MQKRKLCKNSSLSYSSYSSPTYSSPTHSRKTCNIFPASPTWAPPAATLKANPVDLTSTVPGISSPLVRLELCGARYMFILVHVFVCFLCWTCWWMFEHVYPSFYILRYVKTICLYMFLLLRVVWHVRAGVQLILGIEKKRYRNKESDGDDDGFLPTWKT